MTLSSRLAKLEAIAAQRRKAAQAEREADERDALERVYRLLSNGALTWRDDRWAAGEATAEDALFGKDMAKLAGVMNAGPRFTAAQLLDWAEQELGGDPWERRKLAETKARL